MKKVLIGLALMLAILTAVAGCSSGDPLKEANSSGVQAESSSKGKGAKGRQIVIDNMKEKIPTKYEKQRLMDIKNKDLYSIRDDGAAAALGVSLNQSLSDLKERWGEPDHISQRAPGDHNHQSDRTTYYLPGKGQVEAYWVQFWTWETDEYTDAIEDINVVTIYKNGILPNLSIPKNFSKRFEGEIYKLFPQSGLNLEFHYISGTQDGQQVVKVTTSSVGGASSPQAKSVPSLVVHLNTQGSAERKLASANEELTMEQAVKFAEDEQIELEKVWKKEWEEEEVKSNTEKQ
ncbi:hypothetical protein C1N61_32555 (plasmid) [Priestia aryabhattai]